MAQHVLGMTTVIWNHDSMDWSLNQVFARGDFVDPPYDWLTLDLSIQAITDRMRDEDEEGIIILEHELSDESVEAFIKSYPNLERYNWRSGTMPDLLGMPWYQDV